MLRLVLALTPTLFSELEPITDPPPLKFDKDDDGKDVPVYGPRATIRTAKDVVEVLIPDALAGPFFKRNPTWLAEQKVLAKDNLTSHRLRLTFNMPAEPVPPPPDDGEVHQAFIDLLHKLGIEDEPRAQILAAYQECRAADHRSIAGLESFAKAIRNGSVGW